MDICYVLSVLTSKTYKKDFKEKQVHGQWDKMQYYFNFDNHDIPSLYCSLWFLGTGNTIALLSQRKTI